jgi:hypothetical protein
MNRFAEWSARCARVQFASDPHPLLQTVESEPENRPTLKQIQAFREFGNIRIALSACDDG